MTVDARAVEWAQTMRRLADLVEAGEIPRPFGETDVSWFLGKRNSDDDGTADAVRVARALRLVVTPDHEPSRNGFVHVESRLPGVRVSIYTQATTVVAPDVDPLAQALADRLNAAAR